MFFFPLILDSINDSSVMSSGLKLRLDLGAVRVLCKSSRLSHFLPLRDLSVINARGRQSAMPSLIPQYY